jgi:3-hydroxyisobutyrate dehydrogenase-like beta-hydroxyacid dehydrogenase
MGGAISRNLMERGWAVVGFDTDPSRRSELGLAGVTIVDSAGSVASHSSMIMTSLPNADAANAVATEIACCGQPARTVIELSTLTIADKLQFKAILEPAGHIALDCPLSGTGAQAAVRDLVVYASGDSAAITRCRGLFDDFAKQSADLGAYGNGSRMKFVANHLVAIHNVASAEAMMLAERAGLDLNQVIVEEGHGHYRRIRR